MAEELRVRALDGFELGATSFEPADGGHPRGAVVIASATGVPRRIYDRFAAYLAEAGLAALSFDYRGIGGSRPPALRGFPGAMRDWGEKDLAGAIAWLGERWPDAPLALVGHSIGGQLLGLAAPGERLRAALMVASQSGYWANWPGLAKGRMAFHWFVFVPLLVRVFGYLPMSRTGGEDVPGGVALEWARWGRHRDYMLGHLGETGRRGYARFDRPLRAYAFTDDHYAPRPTVEALLELYEAAPKELRVLSPEDLAVPSIGHFGFFKEHFRDTLWREAREWLLEHAR